MRFWDTVLGEKNYAYRRHDSVYGGIRQPDGYGRPSEYPGMPWPTAKDRRRLALVRFGYFHLRLLVVLAILLGLAVIIFGVLAIARL
jgi:hypothetical protein